MMGAQMTTLVGRALAPLQEFKLQRKSTTWGIFDILEGAGVPSLGGSRSAHEREDIEWQTCA